MMLTVFCVYTKSFQPLADLVLPVWREYCAQYGYQLFAECLENDGHLAQYHYSYFKIEKLLEHYKREMPQATWAIDLDMLPTNFRIAAQNFPSAKHAITITQDCNGLNSGSFFLSGFWMTKVELWLKTIISLRHYTTSEQHAMWQIEEAFKEDTFYYPQPCFNSIDYAMYRDFEKPYSEQQGQWKPGHLLVHLPGKSLQERLDLFPCYLPHIIR